MVHTKGLQERTVQSYLGWVIQLDKHFPEQETTKLDPRQILDFLIHLQRERKLAGSTTNQAVCALRTLFRDHLGFQWTIWNQVKILRV